MTIAVVICTEPHFEHESRLLVRSIRAFGGILSEIPIISYSPRRGIVPSQECLEEFGRLNVNTILAPLNVRWPDDGLANKPVVCSHSECNLPYEILVFLDSDMLVIKEPTSLVIKPNTDAALRPVGLKGIGVMSESDPDWGYWQFLYRQVGRSASRLVRVEITGETIFEYYNSGLICARRAAGLFRYWYDVFAAAKAKGPIPTIPHHIEQSCLSAAITGLVDKVEILPITYNYFGILPYAAERRVKRGEVSIVHYLHAFQSDWRSVLNEGWFPEPENNWLKDNMEELGF